MTLGLLDCQSNFDSAECLCARGSCFLKHLLDPHRVAGESGFLATVHCQYQQLQVEVERQALPEYKAVPLCLTLTDSLKPRVPLALPLPLVFESYSELPHSC